MVHQVFLDFKTDGFNVFVCKFDDKGLHWRYFSGAPDKGGNNRLCNR